MRLAKNRLYGMKMTRGRWQNATNGSEMLPLSRHYHPQNGTDGGIN